MTSAHQAAKLPALMINFQSPKAFIFDLDGTLVDSKLNFEKLREDLGLSPQAPILEEIATWPTEKRLWAEGVIDNHELTGAKNSVLIPGVSEFLQAMQEAQIPSALFTRNSRRATQITLEKHGFLFDAIVTRDEAPPKPRPEGLLKIAMDLQQSPSDILFVGDYLYDLQAGMAAQMPVALFDGAQPFDFETQGAHYVFSCFFEFQKTIFAKGLPQKNGEAR